MLAILGDFLLRFSHHGFFSPSGGLFATFYSMVGLFWSCPSAKISAGAHAHPPPPPRNKLKTPSKNSNPPEKLIFSINKFTNTSPTPGPPPLPPKNPILPEKKSPPPEVFKILIFKSNAHRNTIPCLYYIAFIL